MKFFSKLGLHGSLAVLLISVTNGGESVNPPPIRQAEESAFLAGIHGSWHSHYFSEGQDALDGADLVTGTAEFAYDNFGFFAWYGDSAEVDYAELQLGVEYGVSIEQFDFYVGYVHLEYDDAGDTFGENEVGAGVAWNDLPLEFTVGFDWYYSFDLEGSYMQTTLARKIEVTDRFVITPVAGVGFNSGYLGDGHRGANSVLLQIDASFALTDKLSLTGYVAYNWAIDRDAARFGDDELLRDLFFGGVGLAYHF